MSQAGKLVVELSATTKEGLDYIASRTNRPVNSLVVQAISRFTERELEIIEAIELGREQVRNGKTLPHEEVFAELFAVLDTQYEKG